MVFVRETLSFFVRYNMYCHVGKKWNPKLFLVCVCIYVCIYIWDSKQTSLLLALSWSPRKKANNKWTKNTPYTHICWLFENLWATLNYDQSISRKMKMTVFLFFWCYKRSDLIYLTSCMLSLVSSPLPLRYLGNLFPPMFLLMREL